MELTPLPRVKWLNPPNEVQKTSDGVEYYLTGCFVTVNVYIFVGELS